MFDKFLPVKYLDDIAEVAFQSSDVYLLELLLVGVVYLVALELLLLGLQLLVPPDLLVEVFDSFYQLCWQIVCFDQPVLYAGFEFVVGRQ